MLTETLNLNVFAHGVEHRLLEIRPRLIIADPPYGRISKSEWDRHWDSESYLHLAGLCERVLPDGGSALIYGGLGKPKDRPFLEFLGFVEENTGLTIKNVITWGKKRAYGVQDNYLYTREELVWLLKGKKPSVFNIPLLDEKRGYTGYNKNYPAKSEYKRRTNVWTDVTEVLRNKLHEAEKPRRLAEILIETHTLPGDIVADLFAGCGNVSVIAKSMGRGYVAVEKDEETYKKLCNRLKTV